MTLAPHIRTLGRGPSRSRNLTRDEARAAMAAILTGKVPPEAVGALLMLMRFHGETAEEVAGFADALRATLPAVPRADLDWPSYAAGRSRGAPLFLLAARLVADAGYRVLLHGWNSHQSPAAAVRPALRSCGIEIADGPEAAAHLLARDRITYLPLESFSPKALRLLRLRDVLGLRSAVNTVCRVLNPGGAAAAVQGVFHPPYRALQRDASALLGLRDLTVLKGGGGEFERHPDKPASLTSLRAGRPGSVDAPPLLDGHRRLADQTFDLDALATGRSRDALADAVIVGTAALALETLGARDALTLARDLWAARAGPVPA